MPAWLCEHPGGDLRFPDLLQGRSYQRQSLSVGLDEYRCWLLQEEDTWDFLSKRHSPLRRTLHPSSCGTLIADGRYAPHRAIVCPRITIAAHRPAKKKPRLWRGWHGVSDSLDEINRGTHRLGQVERIHCFHREPRL